MSIVSSLDQRAADDAVTTDQTSRNVNLLDLVVFFVRWRRFLLAAVLSSGLVVAVISFLLTPRYRSTVIVRAAESSNSGLGGLLAAKLSSVGGIGGLLPSFGEVPGELYVTILKSRWMFERLIEAFDLRKIYHLESGPLENVIQVAQSRTRFELQPESQTILIYADDADPVRAQAMAQFLADELDKRNQSLRSANAREQREYLGARLDETRQALTAFEDSLVSFQIGTGIVNPEEQVKATINTTAALEAERLAAQVELEMSRHLYGEGTQPDFLGLRLASIDSALYRLAQSKSADEKGWDVMLHLQDAPESAIRFVRLKRDIEIHQILTAILIQEYEQAKLDEMRNTPTIMRVDPPVISEKKSWPRRGLMVGAASICSLILSSFLALLIDFFRATRNPAHPQHERMGRVRASWIAPKRTV
jgi:uncharacterized protein involved in exopolysaccharide biosynthesis